MNESSNRVVVVFTEAVQLPVDKRAAYLEHACGGDAKLRQEVEAMLGVQDSVGDFLEDSPQKAAIEARSCLLVGEKEGDRVGRYKLLQQIGEGGCGVVYMAEQEEPIRRRVALKIIKPGMDTKSVIARFESERQALALMDHPNIAHAYDAGATENGRPYFVMELVRGIRITEFCDQNVLTTRARLELFTQVCGAIQHAHQNGIIHRDIKPSNILVTIAPDGRALPKVIDFGIAKATTGQRLTDKTLFTAFELLIGTPAYMSPEQAVMSSVDVDTRTDIYSLGVLLYELLTGTTPFDTQELLKAGLDEVRRVINNQEPVRPSTRLSTMVAAALTSVSRRHQAESSELIRDVRGDLDWIVMKALEKDRARRYATANELAMDVQRYSSGDIISARPPSTLYRVRKLALRNRIWFGAIGLVLVALIAGLSMATWSLTKEKRARREADTSRMKAEMEAAKSREVTRFLQGMLKGVGNSVSHGQDAAMLTGILDQTSRRMERELANQPEVSAELMCAMAEVYAQLGDWDNEEAMSRRALALYQKLPGEAAPERALGLVDLSNAHMKQSRLDAAEKDAREALDIQTKLPGGGENTQLVQIENQLAWVLTFQGKLTEAESLFRGALATAKRLGGNPSEVLLDSENGLGGTQNKQHRYREAEDLFRDVVERARSVLGADHAKVGIFLANLSYTLMAEGKYADAEISLRECVALRRKILRLDHPDFVYALEFLKQDLIYERKLAEAAEVDRELVGIRRRNFGDKDSRTVAEVQSLEHLLLSGTDAAVLERLFREFPDAHDTFAAVEYLAQRARWDQAIAAAKARLELRQNEPSSYHLLAPLLVQTANRAEYEELCGNIATRFKDIIDPSFADQLAKDCLTLPRPGADLAIPSALADLAVTRGSTHSSLPFFQSGKALAEFRQGHWAAASDWAQRSAQNPFPYSQAEAYAVLAMAEYQLGQKENARAALEKCAAIIETQMPKLESGDLGQDWRDWIISHQLLSEARGLIEGDHRATGNPQEK